jgi:hypothetical protein
VDSPSDRMRRRRTDAEAWEELLNAAVMMHGDLTPFRQQMSESQRDSFERLWRAISAMFQEE